jgi:hypothetical protein
MSKSVKRILIVIVVLILAAVTIHFGAGSMKSLARTIHGAPSGR